MVSKIGILSYEVKRLTLQKRVSFFSFNSFKPKRENGYN